MLYAIFKFIIPFKVLAKTLDQVALVLFPAALTTASRFFSVKSFFESWSKRAAYE